jgi:hypothetical protein
MSLIICKLFFGGEFAGPKRRTFRTALVPAECLPTTPTAGTAPFTPDELTCILSRNGLQSKVAQIQIDWTMSLLDATPPKPERPIWRYILIVVAAAIAIGVAAYVLWDYPEERAVTHFMRALERGDYKTAYRLWQPSGSYSFDDFMKDWGPKGDYGKITSFDILDASSASSQTVTLLVVVNNQTPALKLLVDRKTKGLAYSPY